MYFLALESSCDETAAAVFTEDRVVLSNVVASQNELHTQFGGVVPEIAARAHLRNLLPVIDEALRQANITIHQVNCIAVHHTPGLVGALLITVTAAKMLSVVLDVPLIALNHIQSHIYACRMSAEKEIFPCVGLVVSGGHTAIFDCASPLQMSLLGSTRDDAAGEAFDKVAAILEIGFPGGPKLEKIAKAGNPHAFSFPRAFLKENRIEFSFSGLKTAVLYEVKGQKNAATTPPEMTTQRRADVAASFQQAVVDVLVAKSRQALHLTGYPRLAVGGGVIANQTLRTALKVMTSDENCELFIPPMSLCTDNAAMAALAVEKYHVGDFAPLDLDAKPNFL
ncbi:MAG: tRNA (adenosine(37)-N6)-threonylcarbamoyltransferase complex transferase subunit TsaD [Zavarzinella sp.]